MLIIYLITKNLFIQLRTKNLGYNEEIRFDKSLSFEYYIFIKSIKLPILFDFCPIKDYNTIIIKSCRFFNSFAIYFAINFVFFNGDTIHKIYENVGKYDIIDFIPL